ncbi:MAG: hypothetical protein OHK0045_03790 [Raineya sp.]
MLSEQDKHPIFRKHQNIISDATEISLYKINSAPTAPAKQDKNKEYMGDYEVKNKISLEEQQQKDLQKMVLDTNNYISDNKYCPMQAEYAIKFQKKKHYIILIVSENSCKKTLLVSSEKDINKHYHDLDESNAIHSFLAKL